MAYLTPTKTRLEKVNGGNITIKEVIISDTLTAPKDIASWIKKGQPMKPRALLNNSTGKPSGITVHNTADIKTAADTNAAEQYCRATYNGNMAGVVVTFYVYKAEIWQLLKETERGWHAADGSTRRTGHDGKTKIGGNLDTISIEVIGNLPETEETAKKLIAYLLNKYSLSLNDVYTHNFWMHGIDKIKSGAPKNCPIYILPKWDKFVADIAKYMPNIPQPQITPQPKQKIYRVQIGAFGIKANADKYAAELKGKGYSVITALDGKIYRVQVGAFSVRANADKLAKELQSKGYKTIIKEA